MPACGSKSVSHVFDNQTQVLLLSTIPVYNCTITLSLSDVQEKEVITQKGANSGKFRNLTISNSSSLV